ncbi:MAG: hypothetical protein AAGF45_04720, partial [Pseudomonadota bacterium]
LSGFLTTIAVGRAWALVFLRPADGDGEAGAAPATLGPATRALIIPVTMFAALVIGLGLFPSILIEPAEVAAAGLIDPDAYIQSVLGTETASQGEVDGNNPN